MKKLEVLKKMIADISNDEKYSRTVFTVDDLFFVICDDEILATYTNNFPDYFIPEHTKEEFEYVQRIETELDLDEEVFLPYKGEEVDSLEELIEYYEDEDEEDKIEQIKKLVEVLSDEKSLFYNREQEFLNIFLNQELESGVPYVHCDWDHDDSYYYDLDYSIGVCDPLYDVIVDEPEFTYPDDIEDYDDCVEQENECERWIEILSKVDEYILK